jgi:hypothetical protein
MIMLAQGGARTNLQSDHEEESEIIASPTVVS